MLAVATGCASVEPARQPSDCSAELPGPVARFRKAVGSRPTGQEWLSRARESLWDVYPMTSELKRDLVAYLCGGLDGPALAFAATALIPFHDPGTARAVLERALDARLTPATRWYLMSAAPYILAMGDVWVINDGSLNEQNREVVSTLLELSDQARRDSLGRAHARRLRSLYDEERARRDKNPDYGLALWHLSAYLVGTLDLRDLSVLEVFVDPAVGRVVFANVMWALSLAANRDFLGDLRDKKNDEISPAAEQAAASAALGWWRRYLHTHPDGDDREAVLEGFQASGYRVGSDLDVRATRQEVLRAMDARSVVLRYNVYRLLNRFYGTHFDLERIFAAGKYSGFVTRIDQQPADEARLRRYWQQRLRRAA
jgi:hypothetical protein